MKLILYLIFLIILLIGCLSYKEGFATGQYAYLAPSSPLLLDETTKIKFVTAYNKSVSAINEQFTIKEPVNVAGLEATLEEVNYYIQQNKWPYGSYILNYLTTNKDTIFKDANGSIKTIDDIQKIFPTRLIYRFLIKKIEMQLSPPPLSNDIYMGKAVAPPEAPVAVKNDTATIHPPFSTENYSKLQSICSTLR